MEVAVSPNVIARNSFGQFIAQCEIAGVQTMQDVADAGAELSRQLAPVGKKPDPRTPKLRDAIFPHAVGTRANWKCVARHAVIVEKTGSVQHFQTGRVTFEWEKMGRMWRPGDNLIDHPPTTPQPYLRPAYEVMMQKWSYYAHLHYPN